MSAEHGGHAPGGGGHGPELVPIIKGFLPFLNPIPDLVIYTWIVMAFIIGIALLVRRKMEMVPRGWQNIMEMTVDGLARMVDGNLGKKGRKLVPLIITLFIFILVSNYTGLIPTFRPPTGDLNTPAALALIVFFTIHVVGMMERGVFRYWKHFIEPYPFMLPLNIVEELAKPVSLSLRLFGNIMGKHVVITVLFMLAPFFVPIPMMMFGLFISTIQAFVFTILTIAYLTNVMGEHH